MCVDDSNTDLFLRLNVYLFLAHGEIDHFLFFIALCYVSDVFMNKFW